MSSNTEDKRLTGMANGGGVEQQHSRRAACSRQDGKVRECLIRASGSRVGRRTSCSARRRLYPCTLRSLPVLPLDFFLGAHSRCVSLSDDKLTTLHDSLPCLPPSKTKYPRSRSSLSTLRRTQSPVRVLRPNSRNGLLSTSLQVW